MPEQQARLRTAGEVADYLRVSVQQLYTWRYLGRGPRAAKVGRHLRYRDEDVEKWLAECSGGDAAA